MPVLRTSIFPASEAGFLRGLDDYWVAKAKNSFAYQGVALFDANGASKIEEIAAGLKELSYDVAVLADSDEPDQFSDADAESLSRKGIAVTKWQGAASIEDRVFADLPWRGVTASFEEARAIWRNDERLLDQVQTQYGADFDRNFAAWADEPRLRSALGKAAKASDWFKRQSWGQEWAAAISGCLDDESISGSDLVRQLNGLRGWIDRA